MATNLNAYARYRAIDSLLINGRRATFKEIKAKILDRLDLKDISKKTIENDIRDLRYEARLGFYAPILCNGFNEYYYEDPNYSIDNRTITDEEIEALVLTTKLLDQYKDLEMFKTFSGTAQRLIDDVNIFKENKSNSIQNKVEVEHVQQSKGREHLQEIFHCLANNIVLQITYHAFDSDSSIEIVAHPYYLKEYRNRWYLVGYNEIKKEIRTFGLDRIVKIERLKNHTFTELNFKAKDYYKNTVGVTVVKERPIKIELAFTKFQSRYLLTQPLHHSQEKVEETEDEVIFEYFLIPTFEFTSQILGWNDQVKVLSPKLYRDEITQKIKATLKQYES